MIQHIHAIVRNQISMDRCTGSAILQLRAATVTMEHSYLRLEAERLIVIGLVWNPPAFAEALELYKRSAQIEQVIQKGAKTVWEFEEKQWNYVLPLRCQMPFGVHGSKFPHFPYEIVNPETSIADLKRLRMLTSEPRPIRLRLDFGKLRSTARMERNKNHEWKVAWIF